MPGLLSDPASEVVPTDDGPLIRRGAPERRCIVTREVRSPADMIRFVVGPDDQVVPDLRRKLPGRGAWVSADRVLVTRAAEKGLFSKAFRRKVASDPSLATRVDGLLAEDALGALGLARRAGRLVLGFSKVADLIRKQGAAVVLTASDAAEDGRGKLEALRRAASPDTPNWSLFTAEQMSLAFGAGNVIHAALQHGHESEAIVSRLERLARFRGLETSDDQKDTAPMAPPAA
ncbi:MAG: RNA-binding protein [Pseudomonadota bacterium]